MKFINKQLIEIDRELSDLDVFTIEFTSVLITYSKYVIVSGYVAILLGRARASEDVDIIIPPIDFPTFQQIYQDLKDHGFYCLNAEEEKTVYSYLTDNLALRFAKQDTIIPNIEMKWSRTEVDAISLEKSMTVKIKNNVLYISNLEIQIAFKEEILQSPKDREDANHIREVAKDHIDHKAIKKYKELLHGVY